MSPRLSFPFLSPSSSIFPSLSCSSTRRSLSAPPCQGCPFIYMRGRDSKPKKGALIFYFISMMLCVNFGFFFCFVFVNATDIFPFIWNFLLEAIWYKLTQTESIQFQIVIKKINNEACVLRVLLSRTAAELIVNWVKSELWFDSVCVCQHWYRGDCSSQW